MNDPKPTPQNSIKPPQHDQFFRSTFEDRELFRKLLIWLLPFVVELFDSDRMELQKDSLIDDELLKSYYTDLLYKIPLRGTDENVIVFILVEHKTVSERWTMFQILRYIVQIWQREYNTVKEQGRLADFLLPPILPIIVYQGERKYNATVQFGKLVRPVQGLEKYTFDFEGILLDLTQMNETDLPEDLELSCVLAVMQAVFRKDVAGRMLNIYKKLKPKFGDKRYHDRWLKLYSYMQSNAKYLTRKDIDEVKSQMSETDVVTIPLWVQETREETREEGREEGREKMIEALMRILAKRLGAVPTTIHDKLYVIHDFDVLVQLTDVALDCKSPDEFEQALNR